MDSADRVSGSKLFAGPSVGDRLESGPPEPEAGVGESRAHERPVPQDLRAIRRALRDQAELLDRLATKRARAREPDWRALLEAAHKLRLLARSLPR